MPRDKIFLALPISWFYADGKATRLGRIFSRFWATWARLGLPPRRQLALEVRGRTTGDKHSMAVVVTRHGGQDYLVSMLGEGEWVKNVRAANGSACLIGRRRRSVTLVEISTGERAPIIREFVRLAPGSRPHIGLHAQATIADCEAVAPKHPVFRVVYRDAGGR